MVYNYYLTEDAGRDWRTSGAKAIIDYHSKKLYQIRMGGTRSYRDLILRNYVYLRDAQRDRFLTMKVLQNLQKVGQRRLEAMVGGLIEPVATGDGGMTAARKCKVCSRGVDVHNLNGRNCPLQGLKIL